MRYTRRKPDTRYPRYTIPKIHKTTRYLIPKIRKTIYYRHEIQQTQDASYPIYPNTHIHAIM